MLGITQSPKFTFNGGVLILTKLCLTVVRWCWYKDIQAVILHGNV